MRRRAALARTTGAGEIAERPPESHHEIAGLLKHLDRTGATEDGTAAEEASRLVQQLRRHIEFEHVDSTPREYSEADISPYFWHNGAFPTTDGHRRLFDSGFKDWRLKAGGLVRHPAALSLKDLRALPHQEQITHPDHEFIGYRQSI